MTPIRKEWRVEEGNQVTSHSWNRESHVRHIGMHKWFYEDMIYLKNYSSETTLRERRANELEKWQQDMWGIALQGKFE